MGLGKIGMEYDLNSTSILSHAKALYTHPSYEIVAGIDPDIIKRSTFSTRYRCPAFEDLSVLSASLEIDLFIISCPTINHLTTLKNILERFNPMYILCEKPVGDSHSSLFEIARTIKHYKSKVFVNYIRRCDSSYQDISNVLCTHNPQSRIKGYCYYVKGLYNTASHFISLLDGWLGPVERITRLSFHIADDQPFDYAAEFILHYQDADICFQTGSNTSYSYYDLRLYYSEGIIDYKFGGEQIYAYNKSSESPPTLTSASLIKSDMSNYQLNVYSSLYNAICNEESNIGDFDHAIRILRVIKDVIESP